MNRLDFVEFILTAGAATPTPADLGLCDTMYDSFVVSGGSGTSTTSKIPTICGVNTGLHSKLFSSTGAPLVKNHFINNHKRSLSDLPMAFSPMNPMTFGGLEVLGNEITNRGRPWNY